MPLSTAQQDALDVRRARVEELHSLGLSITETAERLASTYRMIENDLKAMQISRWSDISDAALDEHILGYLRRGHGALGRRLLDGRLVVDGLHVQRRRVEESLARLGRARAPPRRRVRRRWYEGIGSFYAVHVDQNEKLGFAGIKFLAAIDGRWRCPLHWEVVTNLTGLTHARFINNLIRRWGCVPAHIVLDGAGAWSCVEDMMRFYYGPRFDDVDIVPLAEGNIAIRRFQRTSSVHSTPIERSWADVNDVTHKYRVEFKSLEARGLFRGGRHLDPVDAFCLAAVYIDFIRRDVHEHFMSMGYRRKHKDTANPNVPAGARRPVDGLVNSAQHGLPVDAASIAAVDAGILRYHGVAPGSDGPAAPWETDPLVTDADRALRSRMVAARAPQTLSEEYIAMRDATRRIAGL